MSSEYGYGHGRGDGYGHVRGHGCEYGSSSFGGDGCEYGGGEGGILWERLEREWGGVWQRGFPVGTSLDD